MQKRSFIGRGQSFRSFTALGQLLLAKLAIAQQVSVFSEGPACEFQDMSSVCFLALIITSLECAARDQPSLIV
jgi:hypothetical protein